MSYLRGIYIGCKPFFGYNYPPNAMKITLIISTLMFIRALILLSQRLISLGRILLIRALVVSLTTASAVSSWYGFILFLIYITGILVLFGYFLALTPNTLNTAKKCFKSYSIIFTLFLISSTYTYSISSRKINIEKDIISIFTGQSLILYLLLTVLLLVILILVVTLTHKSPRPLRHYV